MLSNKQVAIAQDLFDYHANEKRIFNFSLDGKEHSCFIDKEDFTSRNYASMMAEKKMEDVLNLGIVEIKKERVGLKNPEKIDRSTFFLLKSSTDIDSLSVFLDGKEIGAEDFMIFDTNLLRGIYIESKKLKKDSVVEAEYEYYHPEKNWRNIVIDIIKLCRIFLQAKTIENHSKRIFGSLDEVNKLSPDIITRLSLAMNKLEIGEEELKNSLDLGK